MRTKKFFRVSWRTISKACDTNSALLINATRLIYSSQSKDYHMILSSAIKQYWTDGRLGQEGYDQTQCIAVQYGVDTDQIGLYGRKKRLTRIMQWMLNHSTHIASHWPVVLREGVEWVQKCIFSRYLRLNMRHKNDPRYQYFSWECIYEFDTIVLLLMNISSKLSSGKFQLKCFMRN